MTHKVFTGQDYLSIEDIRVLNTEMAALAALREDIFGAAELPVVNINTAQGINTLPTPGYVNQIERNIDALTGGVPLPGMEPTRTWQGENRDVPALSFRDANRWFESLRLIRASLFGRRHDFKATGSYRAGNCPVRQRIRSVEA